MLQTDQNPEPATEVADKERAEKRGSNARAGSTSDDYGPGGRNDLCGTPA
jgi:hypothetical protein